MFYTNFTPSFRIPGRNKRYLVAWPVTPARLAWRANAKALALHKRLFSSSENFDNTRFSDDTNLFSQLDGLNPLNSNYAFVLKNTSKGWYEIKTNLYKLLYMDTNNNIKNIVNIITDELGLTQRVKVCVYYQDKLVGLSHVSNLSNTRTLTKIITSICINLRTLDISDKVTSKNKYIAFRFSTTDFNYEDDNLVRINKLVNIRGDNGKWISTANISEINFNGDINKESLHLLAIPGLKVEITSILGDNLCEPTLLFVFKNFDVNVLPKAVKKRNKMSVGTRSYSTMVNRPFNNEYNDTTKVEFLPNESTIQCYIPGNEIYDVDSFTGRILTSKLNLNEIYTVYVKVRYNQDSFFMVGNQFGFQYKSREDLEELYDIISIKLDEYLSRYNLSSTEIMYIQVSFRELDKKVYNDLILNSNEAVTKIDNKKIQKAINVPIVKDISKISTVLDTKTDSNKNIVNVEVVINGKSCNFLNKILEQSKYIRKNHKDSFTSFDDGYTFFYVKSKIDYVLATKMLDINRQEKLHFSLSGVLIARYVDNYFDNSVIRRDNNYSVYTESNSIVKTVTDIKLKALEVIKYKYDHWTRNNNIGVIDIETYKANNSILNIYALGFRTNLSDKATTYYIDRDLDSSKLVITMIDELLRPKYSDITFYCHNLGGYDSIFLIKILNEYNENNTDKYKLTHLIKDSRIIKLTIKKGKNSIVILDSYSILSSSLSKLAKDFGVETQKSIFPYKFSLEDNLFYRGETPSRSFYNDLTDEMYSKIYNPNWDFKENTLAYLEDDLNCLYQIINAANKQIHNDYDINIMEGTTISSLALKLFLNKYYSNNIPNINKHSVYKELKESYYGGITEVYKPYGENLYYYDVNSLYPSVALENVMPGLSCSKIIYYKNTNISDLFGFFYCEIESPADLYIGLLPVRNKDGIMLPLGSWSGWYFSEELKFAQEQGYKIKVLKGYTFNREKDTFKNYVNDIYRIKSNPKNQTQKIMAKSLLNNLLGRFGIILDKAESSIMSKEKFLEKSLINKIYSYNELDDDKVLVTYSSKLDYDIINSHNLDFMKVLSKYKDKEISLIPNSSIVISSAITAYARIHINKLKLYVLSKGGDIFYSDTDSLVTDIKLPDTMINDDLGKLKLEHVIEKAIFISGKTYCFIDNNGNYINRIKGIKSSSLTFTDYEKLLNNQKITSAVKSVSVKDWSKGQVLILDKTNITVNSDSYTKRQKIMVGTRWVDTLPNNIIKKSYHTTSSRKIHYRNYFDKCLVVYTKPVLSLIVIDLYKNITCKSYPFTKNKKTSKNLIASLLILILLTILYTISIFFSDDEPYDINNHNLDLFEIPDVKAFVNTKEDYSIRSMFIKTDNNLNPKPSILDLVKEKSPDWNSVSDKPSTLDLVKEKSPDWNSVSDKPSTLDLVKEKSPDWNSKDIALNQDTQGKSIYYTPELETTEFSPFTPKTLEALNHEMQTVENSIKDITNNSDNKILSLKEKRRLSDLLGEQDYFMKQYNNHLDSLNKITNDSLQGIKEKENAIENIEKQLNKLKENLNKYKGILQQEQKPIGKITSKLDSLKSDRVFSTGNWKKGLTQSEIDAIENFDNDCLKNTIKNRIELENKTKSEDID